VSIRVRAPWLTAALAAGHAYFGAGYAFGPVRYGSSPGFRYLLDVAPLRLWGVAFLLGALLTVTAPHLNHWGSLALHLLACLPPAAFAVGFAAADLAGLTVGWGGPVLWTMPVIGHAVLVVARLQLAREVPR
jgi:hypothetical protein